MSFRRLARVQFAALFVLVTFLTVTPNPDDTEMGMALTRWLAALLFGDSAFGDKVAHFLAYAALGGAAALADIRIAGRALYALLGLALYGAVLEAVQGAMGVRQPELADALANALGAVAGYPLTAFLMTRLSRGAAP